MNVLLTSVGRRGYLVRYFRQALNGTGQVIATNTHDDTPGMCEADVRIVVPGAHQPEYPGIIEAVCREHDVRLLCSLHDLDVFVLAMHRDRLDELGVTAVLPDPEWATLCLDKQACGLRLQRLGWHTPWTSVSLGETRKAIAAGTLRFPVIVKARLGFGSLGLQRCMSLRELEFWSARAEEEVASSPIARFHPVPAGESVLFQECLAGPEFCIDVVNDLAGRYVTHFAGQVHAMRAGESDAMTTVDPEFAGELPVQLSAATRHRGILGIDVILDDGTPKVIDINPRFTGDYPFQHLAGADIPAALLAWARGTEPKREWLTPAIGVEGYKDLVPTRVVARAPASA